MGATEDSKKNPRWQMVNATMDLWQLHIFCRLVELKSFSKTANAVHLSQPTVSSHIKDLEERLGCRLIDRLPREATPTGAGEILYGYATRIIDLSRQAEAAIAEHNNTIQGQLVIGGSTIPGGYILPPMVSTFIREYPEVRIRLINGDTAMIIDDVLEGRVELGVVGAKSQHRHIFQQPLFEDEMAVIVASGHPWSGRSSVTLAELAQEPYITREPGSGTLLTIRALLAKQALQLHDFNIIAEMGGTAAVVNGVLAGSAVSIVSRVAVAENIQTGTLKALPIAGLSLSRTFYLTCHKDRSLSPLGKRFIAFLQATRTPDPGAHSN